MDLTKTGLVGLVSEAEIKKPESKRKTKAKKQAKRKVKTKAKKRKAKTARKPKASAGVVRSERLDMRLSKAEKAKIMARAKKTRRTVTSLVIEAIEKIK